MFLKLLVICLTVSSTLINAQNQCGISGNPSGLIVNGTLSEQGAWPWIVAIYYRQNDQFICGGTLVASNVVITAAHCIQNKRQEAPTPTNNFVLKIGKYNLTDRFERGSVLAYPHDIKIHHDWKSYTPNFDADIAVIILDTKVPINSYITPICLWDKNKEEPNRKVATVVGWGKAGLSDKHEELPRQLNVTIKTDEQCFRGNERLALISSANTFCAGRDNFSGPCHGDSGSGLFMKTGRAKRWYLKGIVSSSLLNSGVCDVSNDAIYTNVIRYLGWISDTIAEASGKLPPPIPAEEFDISTIEYTGPPTVPYATKSRSNKKEIFCFYEGWAEGREDRGSYNLNNFKPELCTTAVFMLANLDGDDLVSVNPVRELDSGQNLYKQFTNLKAKNPHLRTLLAVGGWVDGSEKYSQLAADSNRRKRFADNSAKFLKRYGFDGLHFHWEQPAHRGGAAADKQNFVLLLRDLNTVYKAQNLYLSAFLRTQQNVVEVAYDVRNIARYVDAVLLMTFDFSGSWNKKIGFNAPLNGVGVDTVDSRIKYFKSLGVPDDKIIMGIPFFGRTFQTSGNGNIGDATVNDQGFPGPYVKENGFLGYNEICEMKNENPWEITFDQEASEAIGKFRSGGFNNVVTYDTPRSVANKVKYAVENNLGGVWAWFVDTDDFREECKYDLTAFSDYPHETRGPRNGPRDHPLLRTINEAFDLLSTGGASQQSNGGLSLYTTRNPSNWAAAAPSNQYNAYSGGLIFQ